MTPSPQTPTVAPTWIALLCALYACSGCDASFTAESSSAIIAADGGSVQISQARVDIPAGALGVATEVTVSTVDAASLASLRTSIAGASIVGTPVAFTPHGLAFGAPVTLTLASQGEGTAVARLDDESDRSWEIVSEAVVDPTNAVVTTSRFSIYVVFTTDGASSVPDAGVARELFQYPLRNFVSTDIGDFGVADLDGDGALDVVVATSSGGVGQIEVLMGVGDGSLEVAGVYMADPSDGLVLHDVSGDGVPDAILAASETNEVSILRGNGVGGFYPVVRHSSGIALSYAASHLAVGDLTGDGVDDVAISAGSSTTGRIAILPGDGSGGLLAPVDTISLPFPPTAMALGDLDGTLPLDIVVADFLYQMLWVTTNEGDGTFPAPSGFSVDPSLSDVLTLDINADGLLDVVTWHRNGTLQTRLGFSSGAFGAPNTYSTNSMDALRGLAADVTGDGIVDLVSADSAGSISIVRGLGSGSFGAAEVHQLPLGVGSPNHLAAGDFDGDGDVDLVGVEIYSDVREVTVLLNNTL